MAVTAAVRVTNAIGQGRCRY